MNFPSSELHTFWDVSAQQPDTFSALPDDDFLAFLQKQFPTAVGPSGPLSFDNPDGVDPQSISSFPPLNNSPPSSDSSPSPPSTHNDSSLSRRQSGAFSGPPSANGADQDHQPEDGSLKRKANNDNDDEPQAKSQHTSSNAGSSKKGGSNSSRRKSGTPQDETRLLKRKEQNRAAQRAFRERKERHVKDLEDKVAALEAKNSMSEQENENLRELLQRLQNENMMLKQAAFTFTAPRNNVANSTTAAPPLNNHMQFNFASPGAGPSKSPVQQPAQSHQFDLNFNSLIPFDPNTLNPAEDFGTDMDMNVDSFPFAGTYKTIASNPMFTSFAEPSPSDSPPLLVNGSHQFTPGSFDSFTEHWTPPEGSQDALEQLFGGNFLSPNANSVADFQALLASSPSSISPISLRTPSLSSAGSSPPGATGGSSPHTANGSPALHHMGDCPKTKEDLAKAVVAQGQSSFVNSPPATGSPSAGSDKASPSANGGAACEMPFAPVLKKSQDASGAGPFVTCQGSSFPKTEKSDKNVEVLAAWRSITSNPQFKDVDINDLCSEFTNKARCDGTKVVLEPEGVHHIIETLAARQAQSQQQK